ncbi:MAG: amidohydrolase family protein [Rhodobacteraceae bacterium]|nr:amidohydrolase family protein [Paracoccaceae bacterium]
MIDTHQHFWRLGRGGYAWMPKDLPVLFRDYEPHDLTPHLKAQGVKSTVAVQADDNVDETEFLLSLADDTSWIRGVVGWVDLESPTVSDDIARLAKHPKFAGIRPMIQDIADVRWMLRPELAKGLKTLIDLDLTFDALVLQKHLPVLDQFLGLYPDLRVVIDHCAKPVFAPDSFSDWASGMSRIAAHGNTFCKLSGLMTEAPEGTENAAFYPYLDHVIGAFGEDRVMFGSDWPVLNLASEYDQWVSILRQCLARWPDVDAHKVFAMTATKAYPRIDA